MTLVLLALGGSAFEAGLLLGGFSIQATFVGSAALAAAALLLIRDGRSRLKPA